ncbi:MAG: hypothetical protein RIQ60_4412 [Pseudomonadota bacterium]|jgi:uncharacterized protein (TIGR00369 family)
MTLTAQDFEDPRHIFDRVPFIRLLGLRRVFSEGGRAQLQLPARDDLGNVIGAVHGGAVFTLLDVVMASAAVSLCGFRQTAVTLDISTHYLAPGLGLLTADGEVLREGDGLAWCRGRVTDAAGQIVASAQGCFRYLPLPTLPTAP